MPCLLLMINVPVTACLSGVSAVLVLKLKSPSALDKAKLPFTRPFSTYPPAFLIRCSSMECLGLWSCDNGIAFPSLVLITALESPALLTYNTLFLVSIAATAVHPDVSFSKSGSKYINVLIAYSIIFVRPISPFFNASSMP